MSSFRATDSKKLYKELNTDMLQTSNSVNELFELLEAVKTIKPLLLPSMADRFVSSLRTCVSW